MVITHLAVDEYVLVRLALNPCSNAVDIWLRSENIWRSLLPYAQTSPNSRKLGQSSAYLRARKKFDSNDHALLKINICVCKLSACS
jgi:hypothetical protein